GGDDTYALRPEFTPTLARMYATRAKQLSQPTKWFCIPNFFRAERPQRGRLREFFQWNVDVIGGEKAEGDAEVVSVALEGLRALGMTHRDVVAALSDREIIGGAMLSAGVPESSFESVFPLIDRLSKLTRAEMQEFAARESLDLDRIMAALDRLDDPSSPAVRSFLARFDAVLEGDWRRFQAAIVRGLAYYTGMVFEVIAEGERAVAGGGRYDNLIELFGGPPTPACGFGMGDVVLGNLLEDKGLIPEGCELLEALSRPMPLRPDAFVISSGKEGADEQVTPLVARLRRGVETPRYLESRSSDAAAKRMKPWDAARYAPEEGGCAPLHARRSYKATKNVGKLLGEANACHARFAVILESGEHCSLKNLETGEQTPDLPLAEVGARIARGQTM
ncbi:MAG: hypothetical protein CVV40_00630, partial [Planctomycetes bacterium HGW-Planctomycetes-2]